jgi:hypothetical protein
MYGEPSAINCQHDALAAHQGLLIASVHVSGEFHYAGCDIRADLWGKLHVRLLCDKKCLFVIVWLERSVLLLIILQKH